MIDFCTCGSIKYKGNCSNKRCPKHIDGPEMATYKQMDYINELLEKLHDDTQYAYRDMTVKEASKVIDGLLDRLEGRE